MSVDYQDSFENLLSLNNKKLYGRFEYLKENTKPSLEYWARTHPTFSPHGGSHSDNIIEIINTLVPDNVKCKFNDYEIFFLLSAAWLHDIGMIDEPEISSNENRPYHHLKSKEYIINERQSLKLDEHEAIIIADIAAGHRNVNLFDAIKYDNETAFRTLKIRKGLLAAILRLADEMDMTYFRIIGLTPIIMTNKNNKQQNEIKKHLRVSGITPNEDKTSIIVSSIVYSPEEYDLISELVKKINQELREIRPILNRYGLKYISVENKIRTRGFLNEGISLKLDKEKIIDLLIGKSLYNRDDVALRELVQNAIDSCIRMEFLKPEIKSKIEIEFTKTNLIITDTGVGMTKEDAKNFLAKIGNSINDYLAEIDESPCLIAKFGIGFLSYYLIADEIEIWTKASLSEGRYYKINCNTEALNRGWLTKPFHSDVIGTKIKLKLNLKGKNINWIESILYFIRETEFDIIINGEVWISPLEQIFSTLRGPNVIKENYSSVISDLIKDYNIHSAPHFYNFCFFKKH